MRTVHVTWSDRGASLPVSRVLKSPRGSLPGAARLLAGKDGGLWAALCWASESVQTGHGRVCATQLCWPCWSRLVQLLYRQEGELLSRSRLPPVPPVSPVSVQ